MSAYLEEVFEVSAKCLEGIQQDRPGLAGGGNYLGMTLKLLKSQKSVTNHCVRIKVM